MSAGLDVWELGQVGLVWCSEIAVRDTLGRDGASFKSCLWPTGLGPWAKYKPSLYCFPSVERPLCARRCARKLPSVPSIQLHESGR